jgi:hypothetical protein
MRWTPEQLAAWQREEYHLHALELVSGTPGVPWTEQDRERWFTACKEWSKRRRPLLIWSSVELGVAIAHWKATSPLFRLFVLADDVVDALIYYIRTGEVRLSPLRKLIVAKTGALASAAGLVVPDAE